MFPTKIADRLFFALLPPPGAAAELAATRDRLCRGGSAMADARLHVTLLLLADIAPDRPAAFDPVAAAALAVGDAVAAGRPAFRVAFERPAVARGTVVLLPEAPIAPLVALGADLAEAAARAGLALHPGWRFSPHVTLARRATLAPDPRTTTVSWTADRLVLLHSHVGLGRYESLRDWPLA